MITGIIIPLLLIFLLVGPIVDGFAMPFPLAQHFGLILLRLFKVVTQQLLPVGWVVGIQLLFDNLHERVELILKNHPSGCSNIW